MKRSHIIAIICIIIVLLIPCGLRIYVYLSPNVPFDLICDTSTKENEVYSSVSVCADKQKELYGYIEAYRLKHGKVPESIEILLNDTPECSRFTSCSLGPSYIIHPENYGNPDAVLISEAQNKHSNTFSLWIRGIKPCVQTMGDGTIHLFGDSNLVTINPNDG